MGRQADLRLVVTEAIPRASAVPQLRSGEPFRINRVYSDITRCGGAVPCDTITNSLTTSHFFETMSKRRWGFPSETQVKRGVRVVHGDKLLEEKLGRNDLCPCGSGKRFKKCCLKKGCF